MLFIKGTNTLQNPGRSRSSFRRKLASDEVDYECELAVVIGKALQERHPRRKALDYVLGYTARTTSRPATGRCA